MTAIIDIFLLLMGIYLVIGLIFGIYFIIYGAQKLDDGVSGSPWHFKLILLPGSILLWLVLLIKLVRN